MRDIYFESSNINELDHALMEKDSPGAVMWTIMHGILGFFLMLLGISFFFFFLPPYFV